MNEFLDRLPEWGVLILGIVWMSLKAVAAVASKREAKALADEYRKSRSPRSPGDDEVTGKHSLGFMLDRERDREQQELLRSTRANAQTMARLAEAIEGQAALLERLVEQASVTHEMLRREADIQDRIVEHLHSLALTMTMFERRLAAREHPEPVAAAEPLQ